MAGALECRWRLAGGVGDAIPAIAVPCPHLLLPRYTEFSVFQTEQDCKPGGHSTKEAVCGASPQLLAAQEAVQKRRPLVAAAAVQPAVPEEHTAGTWSLLPVTHGPGPAVRLAMVPTSVSACPELSWALCLLPTESANVAVLVRALHHLGCVAFQGRRQELFRGWVCV